MPPDQRNGTAAGAQAAPPRALSRPYFDTPARAERLQLLQHLVRNAGEVIYLRAATGAGKTLFGHRLLDTLGADIAGVWVRGGVDADIPAVVADQLGMQADEVANWPDGALRGIGNRDLLVVVDDADLLSLPAVERLAALHARGGRLLFLGHGGLAQTTRDWDVQFVDLPPFTVQQSAAFLHSNAGDEAAHINEDLAGFLHHSAHGRPGLLLDSLEEVLARARRQGETRDRSDGGQRKRWPWLAGGAATLVLGAALIYQDQINALFEPAGTDRVTAQTENATPVLADRPLPGAGRPMRAPSDSTAPPRLAQAPIDAATADAGKKQGAGPPSIALPELSSLPSRTASTELAAAQRAMAQAAAGAGSARDPSDVLDPMMQDALSAAGQSAEPSAGQAPDQNAGTAADRPVEQPAQPAAQQAGAAVAGVTDAVVDSADTVVSQATAAAGRADVAGPAELDRPASEAAVSTATREAPPAATQPAWLQQQKPSSEPANIAVEAEPAALPIPAMVGERPPAAAEPQAADAPAQAAVPIAGSNAAATRVAAPVEERSADTPPPPARTSAATPPPGPAPVEDRTGVSADKPVAGSPAVAPGASELDVLKRVYVAPATGGPAWLKSRAPERYTLQLVGARDRAAVEKFVQVHNVAPPFAIFERSLSGRPWYSLVAGDYADRDAALAARTRLPKALAASDIWPRTFASVQESLD